MECFVQAKNSPSLTKGKILGIMELDEEDSCPHHIIALSTAEKILGKFNVQCTKMNSGANQKLFVSNVKRLLMEKTGVQVHLYVQKNVHLRKNFANTRIKTKRVAKKKIYVCPLMSNAKMHFIDIMI